MAFAVTSPLFSYDGVLFTVHMWQHILLMMVAAPLLLLGTPITLLMRSVSPETRRNVILPVLHSRVVRALTFPVVAWLLFAGTMWGSHYSPLFNAALEHEWLHWLEHVLYVTVALMFWWQVIGLDPTPWRMAHPIRMLYVFLQMPQNSFLALSIYGADRVLYTHYATTQRTWGPTPLADQQLAAALRPHPVDLAAQVVGVIDRLGERVADPLALAVMNPVPLAVPALDSAALDLDAEHALLGMDEDEVDLAVVAPPLLVADDPGHRVEDVPAVVEPLLERLEHLPLRLALQVGPEQRPRVHPRHPHILCPRRAAPPRAYLSSGSPSSDSAALCALRAASFFCNSTSAAASCFSISASSRAISSRNLFTSTPRILKPSG